MIGCRYDATAWNYPGGGWLLPSVGDYPDGPAPGGHFTNATVLQFSAFCWYFAEECVDCDAARARAPPLPSV